MKKRILSFILALVTVFYILPIGSIPAIALDGEEEETGLSIRDMEVGKLYSAKWDYSTYPDTYLYKLEHGGMVEYDSTVMKEELPQDLIVELIEEGDIYVYITNTNWPDKYEPYRFVDADELVIIGEIPQPTVTYNGEEVNEITLFDDGKLPLKAAKPEGVTADVEWSWEVLVDAGMDTWARVADKVSDVCHITYALVVNILDENDQAKIRAVAYDGKTEYKSDPVTISMSYIPRPIDGPVYENVTTAKEGYNVYSAKSYADNSTETITITVKFVKVRPDGTKVEGANNDFRRLPVDYEGYTVSLPAILGYYTLGELQQVVNDIDPDPSDSPVAPTPGNETTEVTIPVGATSDMVYVVYYYPGETNYTVVHHQQNIYDDQYVEFLTETKTYTVDAQIPDCHYSAETDERFVGFHHVYYEHAEVASDGSTIINIYYDRDYFDVIFVLVYGHAYGQDSLLVKYGTEIGVNIPKCTGFGFTGWEEVKEIKDANGNITGYEALTVDECKYGYFTSDHQGEKPVITSSVNFRAIWKGEVVNYSIVYWLENANDGAYSIWHTQTTVDDTPDGERLTATAGEYVYWDGVILDSIEALPEYKYTSLNTTKSESEWTQFYDGDGVSRMGVVVEGNGSTTLNIYFNRRAYKISFEAQLPATCPIEEHEHGDGTCEYNPIYCTHIHNSSCVSQGHEHDSTCVPTCGLNEHMHESSSVCCNTHVHDPGCYGVADQTLATGLGAKLRGEIIDAVGGILGGLLDFFAGTSIEGASGEAATLITTMAPPKNLQDGYVYVIRDKRIEFTYTIDIWITQIERQYSEFHDLAAIYIGGQWYAYEGIIPENTEDVDANKPNEEYFITSAICEYPDHDHTSGCTYLVCTSTADDHTHIGSCYKCGDIEHIHNDLCYTGCGAGEGCGQHNHTSDCYGNECLKTAHKHSEHSTDGTTNVVIKVLQAKYGQDITELLPYYLELYELGLHQNAAGHNFVGWQYAGTGWADPGETRYVKHVTMVDELCYSEGVTAVAQYDENATVPYLLYYLFESLNQINGESSNGYEGAKEYAADGSARKQNNGVWYDSDPKHVQLIMWPTAGAIITDGEKKIEGMTYISNTIDPPDGWSAVLEDENSAITISNLNAYFYNRNTTTVLIHNEEQIITIGGVKYGSSLSELKTLLKTDAYGKLDVDNIAYPDSLEAGGYEFAGWYSTNYINEHTRIDWDASNVPNAELNLYALWKPVTRRVEVYEDSTLTTKFADDNGGTQDVDHRGFANAPDYSETTLYKDFEFGGWFYIDPDTGEEKAFRFSFAITEDVKIYAKWTSSIVVPYRINYLTPKLDDQGNEIEGEYVQIADSVYRTDIAGQSRTFFALAGSELYSEYQKYYFPEVGSHTIQMVANNIAGEGEAPVYEVNEYSFIYKRVASLKYRINYVDLATGNPLDESDVKTTEDAAVTEIFKPFEGYTVDQYAKLLVLSIPEDGEEFGNNEITFYYTENINDAMITAPWIVYHYIQNLDGTYSVYSSSSGNGEFNETTPWIVTGTPLDKFAGYTFIPDKTDVTTRSETSPDTPFNTTDGLTSSVVDGKTQYEFPINAYGVEINLYYDRDKVGYKVEYRDDRNNVLTVDGKPASYEISANDSAWVHGQYAEVALNSQWYIKLVVQGYQLADLDLSMNILTKQLYIDESQNVIVFYFQKVDTEFNYVIKCDDPDSGVELTWTRDTIAANGLDENGNPTTPVGSMPIESETYYFAGWFKDEDCNVPVVPGTDPVTITTDLENGKYSYLLPTKTGYNYEGESGELFISATYYALFLPRAASIQISVKSNQGDSFILTFTGTDGTALGETFTVAVHDGVALIVSDVKIGKYTVTANDDWSWRYGSISGEITVSPATGGALGGTLELTVSPTTDKWLTDDAYGSVTPTATP